MITGFASTPELDRQGDIMVPSGAQFKLPMPLLWQHKSDQPIGQVLAADVRDDGIYVRAQIAKGLDIPRIDEVWTLIKAGLVGGLSIGWIPIEAEPVKGTYNTKFTKWEWYELSAVTTPANAEATITSIKSLDLQELAAQGKGPVVLNTLGPTSTSRVVRLDTRRDGPMKTTGEQIEGFEAKRVANVKRMETIQAGATERGESKSAGEQEEFTNLGAEVESIDKELVDLRRLQSLMKSTATVVSGTTSEGGAASRETTTSPIITLKRAEPKGLRFARLAMCVAASKGVRSDALYFAETFYKDDPAIAAYVKTAVAGATTANTQGPLLQYTDLLSEFVDYLRPLTIIGKFGMDGIPDVTHVPFNVRVGTQTAGASAGWVGEGKPIALTKGTFGTATLDFAKVAAITVATKEELRFTSISAETKLRNDLANALVARIDQDFVDPTNAGTSSVKPASITYNIAATSVSGTTFTAFAVDLKNMLSTMLASNVQASSLVLIMSQRTALSISLIRTSLGVKVYPDISIKGGFLEGIPVIVSEYVYSLGSPSTNMIIAVNASDVFLADDGVVNIETSDQASLEMSDAPSQDGTSGSGASMVSLWQTQMIGLKATREINWKLMRSASVQYLSGVAYVPQ